MNYKNNVLKSFTLLYVEDEKDLRMVVSNSLKTLFKKVYLAENGKIGLELYLQNANEIDIIMTDINMPIMNGIKMIEAIRGMNTHIPILISTAHNEQNFLFDAIKLKVDAFLLKPIIIPDVVWQMIKALEANILEQKLKNVETMKFVTLGKLAAGITHEINTPLTFIKGNLELLEMDIDQINDEKIKTQMKNTAQIIQDGLGRIFNIVDSMKEIAHTSSIAMVKSNLFGTLVSALHLTYGKIKNCCNVFINNELVNLAMPRDKYCFEAYVQQERLEQVWIIIINNALDELNQKTPQTQRRLDIQIYKQEEIIYIIFQDNGRGIPKKTMENLFEPFKISDKPTGMGIGLSIVKKIIDAHPNISLDVCNNEIGARFEFTISTKTNTTQEA